MKPFFLLIILEDFEDFQEHHSFSNTIRSRFTEQNVKAKPAKIIPKNELNKNQEQSAFRLLYLRHLEDFQDSFDLRDKFGFGDSFKMILQKKNKQTCSSLQTESI